jgi:nitric oxide reductase NorD protein
MSEPEEVILEAAHFVTARARALWASGHPPPPRATLDDVRRRLELFVAAVFPCSLTIGTAEPPAPLSLLARLAGYGDRARPAFALSSTDGARVHLPRSLADVGERATSFYRLLALEQGARAERGTPAFLPGNDRLVRDLYALAEAAAVDTLLATLIPRLHPELVEARRTARSARPSARMTARESAVEQLLVSLLDADPLEPPTLFPRSASPAQSLAWARATAARLSALPGRFRGVAPVTLWGTIVPPHDGVPASGDGDDATPARKSPRTHAMRRRPRVRTASDDEDDATPGTWIVRADDPQQSVEDPTGLQRPVDQEQSPDAAELADSLSDLPSARLVHTPDAPREVLASDEPLPRAPLERVTGTPQRLVIAYPEWDYRVARYERNGALVHEVDGIATNPGWAQHVLAERATLVRRVRRDFERLRPRREILHRQLDGADVDVDAWVTTAADAAAATSPDERLYLADRRARRDAAILLLVDISASTDSWVGGSRRVIDVEREALLIVSEALAALGDRHAIHAFRGEGSRRVELLPLKRFADPAGAPVRARIGGLEPDGYTRVGAAVRHATMLLARERAQQRLLLLLSDGRPNDVDVYEGRYGLEDTRQAFAEARAQDVHPFCVTVDREAPAYASHVFGHGAHAMLRNPERLPQVLLDVLQRLLQR